jgi:hypothetical protein
MNTDIKKIKLRKPQSDNETALSIQLPFAVTEKGNPKL